MFLVKAPYPSIVTNSEWPNPTFSDSEGLTDEVDVKRAMDGTVRTYVKTKNLRRRLNWTFNVTRNKGLEIRAFILSYFASKILVEDHNGRIWVGNFVGDPFEFETTRRSAPAISPMPLGELQTITIQFEGVEQ